MRIKNLSQFPTEEVESLVKFGVGEHFKKLRIEVRNISRGYSGRCYCGKIEDTYRLSGHTSLRKRKSRLVVVRVGSNHHFPVKTYRFKSMPVELVSSWQEAMVLVSAHEAYHHFQFENNLPTSEKYAEMYAIKRLRAWRAKREFIAAIKSVAIATKVIQSIGIAKIAATKCGKGVGK